MPKRPLPQDLPGVEGPGVSPPKFKDIDRIADQFVEVRDEKAELATKLGELEKKIIEKMGEHGLDKYRFSDQEIIVKHGKNKVKIKTVKVDTEQDGEAEEGLIPD